VAALDQKGLRFGGPQFPGPQYCAILVHRQFRANKERQLYEIGCDDRRATNTRRNT
jgi:hypothetical protein